MVLPKQNLNFFLIVLFLLLFYTIQTIVEHTFLRLDVELINV